MNKNFKSERMNHTVMPVETLETAARKHCESEMEFLKPVEATR